MKRFTPNLRTVRAVLWGAVAGSVGALLAFGAWQWTQLQRAPTAQEAARSAITGDFSLVDHTGKRVMDEDYRGKWLLVFFGFTNCPDVCPTTLNEVSLVMDALGQDGNKVLPLFITVDPERDTPEAMAEYVAAFHPRIVGLTGTPEQIRQAAGAFKAYYAKATQEGAPDGYTMNHSAFMYLINPEGEFEMIFRYKESVDEITSGIRKYL